MNCYIKSGTLLLVSVLLLSSVVHTSAVHSAEPVATVRVALIDISTLMMPETPSVADLHSRSQGSTMPPVAIRSSFQKSMVPGLSVLDMWMMAIRTDTTSVRSGPVRFDITNWSRDIRHDLQIVALEDPDQLIPYDIDRGKIPDNELNTVARIEVLKPDEHTAIDVDLAPGDYLLICNIEGHYLSGMLAPLTVTQ